MSAEGRFSSVRYGSTAVVDRCGASGRTTAPLALHPDQIVIQTREDGVSIDQVVLSSEKYLTERPGKSKNDTTILPFTFWQLEG